jgi:thiol-disulfide isomerase/thioredoxin
MRIRLVAAAGLVLLTAIGAGIAIWHWQPGRLPAPMVLPTSTSEASGRLAPIDPPIAFSGFDLVDGAGLKADLAPYRGKVLLVNFWATWCPPCIAELPSLARLQEKLAGPDFAVLPIAVDERDPAKVEAFLRSRTIGLPAMVDIGRQMDALLRIGVLPTSLLVARDGRAMAMFVGDTRWDCGKPLEAVKAFIAGGAISQDVLQPCPEN